MTTATKARNRHGFTIRSQCGACGEDFSGDGMFDRHRVGVHAYSYSEGARMEPPREDGRRCLGVEEMRARGWRLNERGQWLDPVEAARGRMALARTSGKA